jgi:hypothetical protein
MAIVNVFAHRQTNRQTDRWTGQKLYVPNLLIRGIKSRKTSRSRLQGKKERSFHKEHTYEISITYHSKDIANVKVLKSRSNSKVNIRRSKIMVPIKRFVIRNTPMVYESPITYYSKDMTNVIVFKKWVKLQGQGQEVKTFDTNRKVLPLGINIRNMKAILLTIQKICPLLKFLQTDRQTDGQSKNY